jgi:hypothetical protein
MNSDSDDGSWERMQRRRTAKKAMEEQQLKSGKYTIVTCKLNFSDQSMHLRPECEEAYFQNLDNGDSEDLALWRVVRTFGFRCCSSGYICMGFIKKGYEKWVAVREFEDRDTSGLTEFVFEREKCVVDQTRAILEKEGSITKEAFAKIEQEAGEVELIYGWD